MLSVSAMNRQVARSLMPLVLGRDLAAEHLFEKVAVGQVLLARFVQERRQLLDESEQA